MSTDGVLRHHDDVLPPHALSLLQALHQHGYLTLHPGPAASAGLRVAALSVTGTQLLDWSIRQPHTPCPLALLTGQDSGAPAGAVPEPTRARQA
ncbi:hypothetical protein [Amycolatopsis sp. cmx-4-61]|uniref:hypothetical protein n=1 Tax=Amycolatopsis sp. cmx-4-61 TaxID=2790937 RepID=UPI00397DBF67